MTKQRNNKVKANIDTTQPKREKVVIPVVESQVVYDEVPVADEVTPEPESILEEVVEGVAMEPAVVEPEIIQPPVTAADPAPAMAPDNKENHITINGVPAHLMQGLNEALTVLMTTGSNTVVVAAAQAVLYHSTVRLLTIFDSKVANDYLKALTGLMHQHPDVWSPRSVLREVNNLPNMSSAQVGEFTVLIVMIRDLAAPDTRGGNARAINWYQIEKVFNSKYKEVLINHLKDFLHL